MLHDASDSNPTPTNPGAKGDPASNDTAKRLRPLSGANPGAHFALLTKAGELPREGDYWRDPLDSLGAWHEADADPDEEATLGLDGRDTHGRAWCRLRIKTAHATRLAAVREKPSASKPPATERPLPGLTTEQYARSTRAGHELVVYDRGNGAKIAIDPLHVVDGQLGANGSGATFAIRDHGPFEAIDVWQAALHRQPMFCLNDQVTCLPTTAHLVRLFKERSARQIHMNTTAHLLTDGTIVEVVPAFCMPHTEYRQAAGRRRHPYSRPSYIVRVAWPDMDVHNRWLPEDCLFQPGAYRYRDLRSELKRRYGLVDANEVSEVRKGNEVNEAHKTDAPQPSSALRNGFVECPGPEPTPEPAPSVSSTAEPRPVSDGLSQWAERLADRATDLLEAGHPERARGLLRIRKRLLENDPDVAEAVALLFSVSG